MDLLPLLKAEVGLVVGADHHPVLGAQICGLSNSIKACIPGSLSGGGRFRTALRLLCSGVPFWL